MTTHSHDDETTIEKTDDVTETVTQPEETTSSEKEGIEFTVETIDTAGAPVFPEEGEELEAQAGELHDPQDDSVDAMEASEALEDEDSDEDSGEDSDEATDEDEWDASANDSEEVDNDEAAGEADESSLSEEMLETGEQSLLKEELTLAGKIESIIFASPKPMRAVEIHELLLEQGYTLKEVQDTCDELIEFYRDRAGGFHLKYIKRMGYQFQTTPAAKPLMEKQFSSRPRPLSRAALETLAVIAYRQKGSKGVTRAEVEFIRGVDAGSIFKTLVERNLLTCTGRKEIPGRPMMFGVTDEFLKVFQLGSINDLPPLESFQTPQDILQAANDKISAFEAEQEGVDPEAFIGDEAYTNEVTSPEEFNPLAADAPTYAPTLVRLDEVRDGVTASASDTVVEGSLAVEEVIGADEVTEVSAFEVQEAESADSQADLIDVLNEGQVAWAASEVHTDERPIQGATVGEVIQSLDAIDDEEWDDTVQVETTATEATEIETAPPSEAQLDERDETSEVALPVGDSEPPRGGEVDQ